MSRFRRVGRSHVGERDLGGVVCLVGRWLRLASGERLVGP